MLTGDDLALIEHFREKTNHGFQVYGSVKHLRKVFLKPEEENHFEFLQKSRKKPKKLRK